MILDINLQQRGCFVGLAQRFVVFSLKICGFTLIFIKLRLSGYSAISAPIHESIDSTDRTPRQY